MRIVIEAPARRVTKAPRHPEVNQENPTALEPDNQILAATLQRGHAFAFELGRDRIGLVGPHEPCIADLDALEHAPLECGCEQPAHRLDLGQLGHG